MSAVMPSTAALPTRPNAGLKQRIHWSERIAHGLLALITLALLVFLAAPLVAMLVLAFEDKSGGFIGLGNFVAYLASPALLQSLGHSLFVSLLATAITVPLAFGFAYALTRSCMPAKGLVRTISLVPLLAPTLLSAISLIYWFGNQGAAKGLLQWFGLANIYGAPGIVIGECFAIFPHVSMILVSALALSDARLYEAADALGTSTTRKFFTITLPGAKYGLISATLVSFTLVMTDFGIPKVIGGNYNMLATDVFKLVIGQQDFQRGAVVGLLLLTPALLTFVVDWLLQRKQTAMLGARAVPYRPKPVAWFDGLMTAYAVLICALMLAMLGMAVFASFATFWPYKLAPSLAHYQMGLFDAEVADAFVVSLKLAANTALFGTAIVFGGAYLLEKTKGFDALRPLLRLLSTLPMAVPGLVLGLGYILFFNLPANPLHGLYQTLPLLVACTVAHFYTTGHLTATTALKALDAEFEAVSASLKVPFYKTFWRVTLPICLPALVDIARYFFVNAMTTISALVFLYSPTTKVAAIAILNLDESGENAAAAAMAVLITLASTVVSLVFMALSAWVGKRSQAWRAPG
ncbi:MAG: putative 2-aminoethylphosphonate ABC transporter permease subunit [Burkholderiales bacterium]|nr:putative 2-aminoethylphosphonate ABC transporter permease subunit [Burkholderiales bacterium]